jgi:hypothetical protein
MYDENGIEIPRETDIEMDGVETDGETDAEAAAEAPQTEPVAEATQ